ncbi:penicillin-insensitive murein endopeptidase [Alphaproteobacteria bacterium KMM 3653]|uniref:Penicillin-insensitive murein endopeptidase n=1 Tax=Harenicola maris TaxID=2841044 RepID=A0AAP2CRG2_9RHOB|nr:penicillin-insensitive murein endopeptidase [Harenicola maris]
MLRGLAHILWVLLLTALTQLGGIAWLLALLTRRRWLGFLAAYAALWVTAVFTAPLAGREALPCWGDGPLRVASPMFCLMNRHYAAPQAADAAEDLAKHMQSTFPGTVTQVLDASFPYGDQMPLLPHLSHRRGLDLDIAFYYTDAEGTYLPRALRSPIGYWGFEQGPSACPPAFPTLRWNMSWLQPLWPDRRLDSARTGAAITYLIQSGRTRRMFIEPHLLGKLGQSEGGLLRFQGCRAARHDDHLHISLRP